MRRHTAQRASLVTTLALLLAAAPLAAAADHAVTAGPGLSFSPAAVTVSQGDSVTWTNAGGFHNVRFEDDSFAQPPFVSPDPWSVTRSFDAAGTFRYFCDIHRTSGMTGTVDVTASEASSGAVAGELGTSGQPGSKPGGAGPQCASQRRFTIRLRGLQRLAVRSARVELNGKQVPVLRKLVAGVPRHTADIDLRGLPRGAYTVAITVTTTTGRVLRGTRTYRTCAGKLAAARLPDL